MQRVGEASEASTDSRADGTGADTQDVEARMSAAACTEQMRSEGNSNKREKP